MARRSGGESFPSYGPKHQLILLLQSLYHASGLTQKQIAAKAGVSESHLSGVLSGRGNVSPGAAHRIVQAMGASETTARSAERLAKLASEPKPGIPPEAGALQSAVTALVRAWHELEPVAAVRAQDPDSAVRQALEAAVARAITQYATSDGRLDVAGPLLTGPGLLADPAVAAELAKMLVRRGAPDPEPVRHRWEELIGPMHTRDLAVEAAALLEFFQQAITSDELGAWLRGETAAGGALLAEICAADRRRLAEVARLGGTVTTGALPPVLRMRLLDQTGIIAQHVSGFVGRHSILKQINEVITTRERAYCHVLAHPGVGKTALMAKLVKDGNHIHHFNVRSSGVVSAEAFLGNICARLIARYQPRHPAPPQDAFSNGGYLYELLTDIARNARQKIVIVVDALDERDTTPELPGVNPLFLPPSLPSGVIFILASRPEHETRPIAGWQPTQISVTAGCEQAVIPIDHLGEANMADIRTYLEPWPASDGVAEYMSRFGYDAATFIDTLALRSEGNFMYLHHVLPAIARGDLNDRELTELPLGLRQYYEKQLERMRDENNDLWYQYRLPVIAELVWARSRPLTAEEIAALSGLSVPVVKDTLRRWSAFVVAELVTGEDGRPGRAHRIYHASFAEFLDELVS
jgi:transcriptional regulator with XRE-family HTH domain